MFALWQAPHYFPPNEQFVPRASCAYVGLERSSVYVDGGQGNDRELGGGIPGMAVFKLTMNINGGMRAVSLRMSGKCIGCAGGVCAGLGE